MPTSRVKQGAEVALRKIDARLIEAQGRFLAGDDAEKVSAAGELEFLRQQKEGLERRLAELDRLPQGRWGRAWQWLEEEAAMLEQRVEAWIVRN